MAVTSVKYKVKAKHTKPFDRFGCAMWVVFLNVIGLIIAASVCKEKNYLVLEYDSEDEYIIKEIRVARMELFKVDINDIVIEEINNSDYSVNNKPNYWVKKGSKQVKINR